MFANFAGMTPEEIEKLSRLSTMPEQLADVDQQYTDAYDESQMEGPQGRHVGRVFVAQNPLEQLADVLNKRKAKSTMSEMARRRADIYRQQEMARQMMMNKVGNIPAPGMDPTQQGYDQMRNQIRGNGMI